MALVAAALWLAGAGLGRARRAIAGSRPQEGHAMTKSALAPIAYLLLVAIYLYVAFLGGA